MATSAHGNDHNARIRWLLILAGPARRLHTDRAMRRQSPSLYGLRGLLVHAAEHAEDAFLISGVFESQDALDDFNEAMRTPREKSALKSRRSSIQHTHSFRNHVTPSNAAAGKLVAPESGSSGRSQADMARGKNTRLSGRSIAGWADA